MIPIITVEKWPKIRMVGTEKIEFIFHRIIELENEPDIHLFLFNGSGKQYAISTDNEEEAKNMVRGKCKQLFTELV